MELEFECDSTKAKNDVIVETIKFIYTEFRARADARNAQGNVIFGHLFHRAFSDPQ